MPAFGALTEGDLQDRSHTIGENAISYKFSVEDPAIWTKPWSGELAWPLSGQRLFEYACHEGNYSFAEY